MSRIDFYKTAAKRKKHKRGKPLRPTAGSARSLFGKDDCRAHDAALAAGGAVRKKHVRMTAGALFLLPNVDSLTRWAVLLYCALPGSYLSPGLGRSAEDATMASGVCSVLTATCLAVFCVMAAAIA